MRKLFTLLFAVLASVGTLFAWDYERVQIGDLYYNLDVANQTAQVDYNRDSITTANIPDSVTYNSITFSVTSIQIEAFRNCTSLTSVTIPNSVTDIGDYAFYGCSSLTSVTIPNNVTSIGKQAFRNCTSLTSVTIPNSVISIQSQAFYGCNSLFSVTIPNSVTSINGSAFSNCSGLTSINVVEDNPNYCSIDGVLFSKDRTTLIHYPGGIQGGYTIPNSVTSIGNQAFHGYSGLTSVIIPSSVTSIGTAAFSQCTDLTSIEIPNSVTSIGSQAFYNCSGLTSVRIGDGVTSIGDNAFYNCLSLTSVHISNLAAWCTISFGNSTANPLSNAHNLYLNGTLVTDLTIPNSVTSIGDEAFYGCRSLTSVTIPNSVTSIGDNAFYICTGLTSVTIPNSVTSIGEGAFYACTGLPVIDNIRYADIYLIGAVDNSLTTYIIKEGTRFIGKQAFRNCSSLTSLTIPNSVISIEEYAFSGCSGLTSITIPNSVTNIGRYAFVACAGLTSVTIGNSVTSIGDNAFSICSGLTSITCEATTPPACGEYVFLEVNKTIPLYVPAESVELYKAADVWKEFTNIQGITKTTNAAELWPLIMDNQTYSNLEQYIVSDLRPDEVENHFEIFPHDDGMPTYTADYTSGLNSCGNIEGYLALSVESFGWAGCGLRMKKQTSISALQSLKEAIVTNPDNYYLHLSIKSTDSYSHCFYIMGNEATKFVLGNKSVYDGPVYSDFARDGKWHEFYIPLAQYASALDTTDFSAGGYAFIAFTEGVSGAKLHLDAVFFCDAEFKDGQFLLPSSNKCGDNLAWKFDQQTGTLTISGSGAMYDYSYQNKAPWQDYKEAIRSIVLPNGLTTIGAWTFNECSNLSQISIPQNVTSIGNSAFYGCGRLSSFTLPESVTYVGWWAFTDDTLLTEPIYNSHVFAYMPKGYTGEYNIPEGIEMIAGHAFFDSKNITAVTIPSSVKYIYNAAFTGCCNLQTITCKATTPPALEEAVFCDTGATLYVPASSVNDYKASTDQWKDFTNIQAIGSNPEDTTSGKCGDNLAWTFDQQTGTLIISGSGAMYDFTEDNMPWANHIAAITSIELPDGLTTFGTNAFRNCAGVQAIQIPTSLTASGNDAFYGCTGIKEVHVYNLKGWCNVQFGNAYSNPLFYGQLHMLDETTPTTTLRITADITDLGHAFDDYTFEAIEIEDIASFCTMTSTVRAHKIYLNGKLVEHLVIPEGVTLIRAHAFAEATCLKSVTLPTTMTQIGVNTFGGCSNIEYLTIKAAQPPVIDSTTFDGVNHAIPVNIACSSLDRYISAEHWSKFTNFVVPSYNIVKNDSIYENTAYSWRGREIKTDSCGIFRYADSLTTVDGCDSIIALVLTINPIPAYTVTVTADDEQAGTVAGGGIFKMDSVVTLTATANDGYVFAKWSDGSTDNPYIFTAKEDVELVAYFLKDQAEEAEVTEPQVMPTDSSVVITWPVIEDAVVYTIEIKKDGELICTLLFNEMGQLINIVFAAPARQGENKRMPAATRTANGWQYTISGLDPNTEYTYIVKAQKADETVIYEESIDFVTDNAETIGNVQRDDVQCTKVLRDGQLYIIRGDKTYTVTGQEVK